MMFKLPALAITLIVAFTDSVQAQLRPSNGRLRPQPDFVNITCPEVTGEPECFAGRPRSEEDIQGIWVCRTRKHTFFPDTKVSACIDPSKAIENDTCGCCDTNCPDLCDCLCELSDGSQGVLIARTRRPDSREFCVSPERAVAIIGRTNGRVGCVEECETST